MASPLGGLKYRALGVTFLGLILLALYGVYGAFTQKFTHFDEVTLQTDTIGLQLPDRADVKIRGVLIGQVLGTSATAQGAEVRIGINRARWGSSRPT